MYNICSDGQYIAADTCTLAFMVLLVPYIMHYHLLENSVQYMYEQYDRMLEKAGIDAFVNR